MRVLPIFLILSLAVCAAAQSGRIGPAASPSPAIAAQSVKQLFDEANTYLQVKRQSYVDKKVKLTDELYQQALTEQRQLAAKSAAAAAKRSDLAGEDLYHLGMLNWIAENYDGANEWLRKYTASPGVAGEKAQLARTFIVMACAKVNKLPDAEAMLAEYAANTPVKLKQQWQMAGSLTRAYQAAKNYPRMSFHAAELLRTAKALAKDAAVNSDTVNQVLDAGLTVFDAYSLAGDSNGADAALDDMRRSAIEMASSSFYYYAVDKKITYMIETGRKRQAMEFYLGSLIDATKVLPTKTGQEDAIARLKKREPQYKLLGEPATEFPAYDKWFPGKPRTFAEMKGKVVLLDFWATWCGPCFEAYPSLREWQQDLGPEGLEILGVTRYYGGEVGFAGNPAGELDFMKNFRKAQALPYDFVVASDQSLQMLYAATGLPTTVLIDRRGIIRYIETGTSQTRLDEMRIVIQKLLAEK